MLYYYTRLTDCNQKKIPNSTLEFLLNLSTKINHRCLKVIRLRSQFDDTFFYFTIVFP